MYIFVNGPQQRKHQCSIALQGCQDLPSFSDPEAPRPGVLEGQSGAHDARPRRWTKRCLRKGSKSATRHSINPFIWVHHQNLWHHINRRPSQVSKRRGTKRPKELLPLPEGPTITKNSPGTNFLAKLWRSPKNESFALKGWRKYEGILLLKATGPVLAFEVGKDQMPSCCL